MDNVHISCRVGDYDLEAEGDTLPEALAVLAINIQNTVKGMEEEIRVLNGAAERCKLLSVAASQNG